MIITLIHKTGDPQTERWMLFDSHGVIKIERFSIAGLHAPYPRLRVVFKDGKKIELDEIGMTIYSQQEAVAQ